MQHVGGHKNKLCVVKCSKCNAESSADHYHFQKSDLDVRIRCANCSKSSHSKAWSCNCGHLWHICGIHVPALKHGENARNAKPRTRDQRQIIQTASTCKRRLHNNALFEEILDDDLKREAKRARGFKQDDDDSIISLDASRLSDNLRPSWLPLKLRQRFFPSSSSV